MRSSAGSGMALSPLNTAETGTNWRSLQKTSRSVASADRAAWRSSDRTDAPSPDSRETTASRSATSSPVTTARSSDIRSASTRLMVIRFAGNAPVSELELPGVGLVELEGNRVVLRVSSELDPLLAVLARHSVLDLAFPEPSLEEAFVGLYRAAGDQER